MADEECNEMILDVYKHLKFADISVKMNNLLCYFLL